MTLEYEIHTGTFRSVAEDGCESLIGNGCYAGNGNAINDPSQCSDKDHGPLPQGTYTIGAPIDDPRTGPFSLPLTPDPSNEMFGRGSFLIHGDNLTENFTASDGCIVASRALRQTIVNTGCTVLEVIA